MHRVTFCFNDKSDGCNSCGTIIIVILLSCKIVSYDFDFRLSANFELQPLIIMHTKALKTNAHTFCSFNKYYSIIHSVCLNTERLLITMEHVTRLFCCCTYRGSSLNVDSSGLVRLCVQNSRETLGIQHTIREWNRSFQISDGSDELFIRNMKIIARQRRPNSTASFSTGFQTMIQQLWLIGNLMFKSC